MPDRTRLYIGAVALLAAVATVALLAADGALDRDSVPLAAVVALLIGLEHLFATRIARGRSQGETTTHEEAYIVFLALVAPAAAVVAAVTAGFVLGSALARRQALKAVFNVAAIAAAAALGMLVTIALGGGGEADTVVAAAAALAGVAFFALVNRVLLAGVLAIVGAAPLRATLADDVPWRALLLGANSAIGLLAGLAARESYWALPFALLALVVLHFTLAGHGRARAEREKLRDIVDASSNGILVIDDHDEVVSWSAASEEITGYAAGEVEGLSVRRLRELLEAQPYDDPQARPGERYATRIRTKSGELRWLIVTRASLPEGGDLLVAHDDTARRTLEDLRTAQLQERARADLVASVSHELRTPLTSILGFTGTMLSRAVDPAESERYLTIVHEQATRLARLVDDLLELRAVEAEALQLDEEPFDLAETVRREAAAFEAGAPQRPLRVVGLEKAVVRGDRRRVQQVVANLLSNALKYSAADTPVTVRVERADGVVSVTVRDEGVGIAREHQDKLFTPFFRTGDTDARGTGLGLAIARQIVLAHGGTIGFRSDPGAGSEFWFTLPEAEPAGSDAAREWS